MLGGFVNETAETKNRISNDFRKNDAWEDVEGLLLGADLV